MFIKSLFGFQWTDALSFFLSFLFPFLKVVDVPSSVCSVQSDWGMCVASAAKGSERGCNSERLDHQLSAP
jgi:hypothetical protein